MEYVRLGNSGMQVSKFAMGCMGFADPNVWHHKWSLPYDQAKPILKYAIENGINYFDTANEYGVGTSEEIVGKVLREFGNRDEYVLQSKVNQPMWDGPNGGGSSRKHIMGQIDASLKRLGMDYVDIYMLHRWDNNTPIEETAEALNDIVRSGKARYIGCSTMRCWQFQKLVNICKQNHYAVPIVMESHYNPIFREEENEMIPYCQDAGIAISPYSSMAGGKVAHPWGEKATVRAKIDSVLIKKYGSTEDVDKPIVDRIEELSKKYGVKMSTIAIAWHQAKGSIPLVGAESTEQLDDYLKSLEIKLTPEDVAYIDEPYVPHKFIDTNKMGGKTNVVGDAPVR